MKYGIYVGYYSKEWVSDYFKLIDRAAAAGFDILEIACGALRTSYAADESLAALKEHAAEKGLTLTAGYGPSPLYDLSSGDSQTIKRAFEFYDDIFKKLHKLDIHILGGGLYSYWPVDYTKPVHKAASWKNSVKNMREIAELADRYDITLGMEALNRFEGYLINTSEECRQYVEEVDSPRVGIMLDTFHMNIEEDSIVEAIKTAGAKLCHFHVGEQNRKVPGTGRMPWNDIGAALRGINYTGAVVMEPFVLQGGTVGADIKVWRDIVREHDEAALDRDAAQSVQFLKRTFESRR
jgi:D-psicose/D-tagatose/L-ribulose 3-epimerase